MLAYATGNLIMFATETFGMVVYVKLLIGKRKFNEKKAQELAERINFLRYFVVFC